jgi:hypothetical protein
MPFENFVFLQEQLVWAFGWLARWWMILFAVAGIALAAFIFFLQVVSTWLEKYQY